MEIITYLQAHWVEWLFAAVTAAAGLGYKSVSAKLKIEQVKNEAIAEGVQSLLRESIVQNYNKYLDRGYCPIYAKESVKKVYSAYHNLGGNDVATELYHKLLAMPEEKEEGDGCQSGYCILSASTDQCCRLRIFSMTRRTGKSGRGGSGNATSVGRSF